MRAVARLIAAPASAGSSATRLRVVESAPPLAIRRTGAAEVSLLSTAAFPVGGDDLTLQIVVEAGAELTVRSVAAAIAYPGPRGEESRFTVDIDVAAGGVLVWAPRPLVAVDGCRHHALTAMTLADDARLWWREDLRLGRSDEAAGSVHQSVVIDRAGRPLLRNESWLGGGWPGRLDQLATPVSGSDVRAIGTGMVVAGDPALGGAGRSADPGAGVAADVRAARFDLAAGATAWTALGRSLAAVDRQLAAAMPAAACFVPAPDAVRIRTRSCAGTWPGRSDEQRPGSSHS